jgi:hypothetical protein
VTEQEVVLAVRTPWLGSTVRNPAVSELCTSHTEMAPLRQVAVRTKQGLKAEGNCAKHHLALPATIRSSLYPLKETHVTALELTLYACVTSCVLRSHT